MARIAILGWGSLLYDPGCLEIRTPWRRDGPSLPIEFARKSGLGPDGYERTDRLPYLSLVLYPGEGHITTYWTLSLIPDLERPPGEAEGARENLRRREGCRIDRVEYLAAPTGPVRPDVPGVDRAIQNWLDSRRTEIDIAIWTNLEPNLNSQEGLTHDAISFLEDLRKRGRDKKAEDYVRKAPSQTQTPLRNEFRKRFGWTDVDVGY
ncbi:MAG: hypothetical protein WA824_09050 [Candidatus Sulfotelmatobacter sp.]